ncbi:MAG: glycosyltransferase family 9 protein [Verrucomicrobiota bacterium]|nr:glycosyltransferase family 9 protein [Verrucomicrobiota bacterium]
MKVLIVKTSSLGDLFHALPAVHNLKVKAGAAIHWIVSRPYVELARRFADVERVIPFPRDVVLSNLGPFLRELRAETYDLILDMQGPLRSAIVARLARGSRRIGPSFHREGSRLLYDAVAGPRNKNRHAVEENMDFIDCLRIERIAPEFRVSFPAKAVDAPRPRVALLPTSRWPSKNWPPRSFAEVARRLKQVKGASIFLLGDAAGAADCRAIEAALDGGAVNLAGQTSLLEMGGLLEEMDLLLASDTGPVHMAAAVGTPALVVFGPTDPVRTGPYGAKHRVVTASVSCRPCFSRTCRREGIPCLSGIAPEQVAEIALEMLREAGSGKLDA